MSDDRNDSVEFEPDLADQEVDFESDEELEDALNERTGRSRFDGLKARGRQAFSSATEKGRERLYVAADRGRSRLADALDTAAERLDDRLTDSSRYLRTHDVDYIRDDLSNTIRRYTLLSAGVAVGAGYLIGRVFMDAIPHPGRRRKRGRAGKQLSRAVVSSLGAMIAARMRDSFSRPRSPDIIDD